MPNFAPAVLDLLKNVQRQLLKSNEFIKDHAHNANSLYLRADNQAQIELISNYLERPRNCDVYTAADQASYRLRKEFAKNGPKWCDKSDYDAAIEFMLDDYEPCAEDSAPETDKK